ncbi:tetratricopeptide repeat protein [Limibacter armeniacum]|uniref:tetratricopeptide repeat protein n=1 Tax=Limibacter armeniacum TaxID=466084 RepID=UPI002FE5551B
MEDKKNKQQENLEKLIESPEAIQDTLSQTQRFADKNKNVILGVLGAVIAVIFGYFFYQLHLENKNKEAQAELSPAVFYMEKDSLGKALNGDGNFTKGFAGIADEYSNTEAGNLAKFYAGVASMRMGKFDEAISYLKDFSSNDLLVQARAYALIGDAYTEKKDFDNAVSYFGKAVDYKSNEQFTPAYLLKLAFAQEAKGDKDAAKGSYERIINEYSKSQEVTDAKKYLSMLQVVK